MADPIPAPVVAAEKQAETALKQPAKVNWLFIVVVAIAANLAGVLFHL